MVILAASGRSCDGNVVPIMEYFKKAALQTLGETSMNQVMVKSIELGGWGQNSGIQIGDVIESYNAKLITNSIDFKVARQEVPHGATIVVARNGKQETFVTGRAPLGFEVSSVEDVQGKHSHDHIIVTTTPSIDGYRVVQVLDIVTSECVFGMNIFKDFLAGMTDILGGRSDSSQNVLREARQTCIDELKREAFELGANAVIGVDLDYSELSGQGKSMLFLVGSGTAVVLTKSDQPNVRDGTEL